MASKIQPKILSAGIDLFSDFGYYGVTTRDLAKKARTTEGSLYRLFESKEKLFEEALKYVIDRSLDPAQFLLALFENEQAGKPDFSSIVSSVLRRWYASLPQKSARLLTQAYFVRPKLRHMIASPYASIDKIIDILATAIGREQKSHSAKANAKAAATAIILTLLHFKITSAATCSVKQETEMVESFVQLWLHGLFPPAG
jgi:AcrR family transcriptional regulator